ncbi:MAG: signal peptidase I [Gammaproteobacteria bacterium]|nr:MAG: signal peptidase I [Gammaproteobacteria bacterium]
MHLDFAGILVFLTVVTGTIWGIDALLFAPRRRAEVVGGGSLGDDTAGALREPVVVDYARSFFPVILIVLIIRSFLFEPFRIPSSSMMPTLLIGDFILVNKFAYGLRLPVLNTKFLEFGEPQRGDVTVFRFPKDPSVDYIKRIVGLPGDRITYRDKVLFINGERMDQRPLGRFMDNTYRGEMRGADQLMEDLSGVQHDILVRPNVRGKNVIDFVVPEGHFFAMGDNRDNSNDSRFWGPVPEENLVGKAFAIWMNWDPSRSGFPVDFGRIGDSIN